MFLLLNMPVSFKLFIKNVGKQKNKPILLRWPNWQTAVL